MRPPLLALLAAIPLACRPAEARPPARPPTAAGAPAATDAPRVIADERGFTPGTLALARGGAGAIVFRRTTDDTCATAVVFPELGLEKDLPLGQDVPVAVPTGEARTLTFQCGMGMYRSQVVVR